MTRGRGKPSAVPHTDNGVRLRARGQTTTSVSDPFFWEGVMGLFCGELDDDLFAAGATHYLLLLNFGKINFT